MPTDELSECAKAAGGWWWVQQSDSRWNTNARKTVDPIRLSLQSEQTISRGDVVTDLYAALIQCQSTDKHRDLQHSVQ